MIRKHPDHLARICNYDAPEAETPVKRRIVVALAVQAHECTIQLFLLKPFFILSNVQAPPKYP